MKELPRKLKRFVVAHGPQSLILVVGGVALIVSGMFVFGSPVFGLNDDGSNGATTSSVSGSGSGEQAQVQASDSVASIKDQDGDKDGLSDLEERLYHTNPQNEDTDGDGYKDGEEVEKGYDPSSKLSAGAEAASSGDRSSASLLSLLDTGSPTGGSAAGDAMGVGGLGGITDEQSKQIGEAVLPDGQKLADLEVDQILNKGSQPLPTVDRNDIATTKDSSAAREQEYFQAVAQIVVKNNPFPAGYTIKKYLTDIENSNRDMFEKMKFSSEALLQQMQALTVPESMVEEHSHALGILLAARESLQQVLSTNLSSDSILALLGRSFFVVGEMRLLLQEAQVELQS